MTMAAVVGARGSLLDVPCRTVVAAAVLLVVSSAPLGNARAQQADRGTSPVSPDAPATVSSRRTEARIRLRLGMLERDLRLIDNRWSIGVWAAPIATTTFGGVLALFGASGVRGFLYDDPDELYLMGSVIAARGALLLFFVPSLDDAYEEFDAMPAVAVTDAFRKAQLGRRILRHAATSARTDRLVSGVSGLAVTAAYFGIALPTFGLDARRVFDWVLAIYAGITVIEGIISLVVPSKAERMWTAYRRVERRRGHGGAHRGARHRAP